MDIPGPLAPVDDVPSALILDNALVMRGGECMPYA